MKHRKILTILLSLAVAFTAASCKKDEVEETTVATTTTTAATTTTEETTTETTEETINYLDGLYDPNNPFALNPITGVQDMDPANEGLRSVAVVINNCFNAMPQRGIGSADAIYEYETEGGQTRLLALFADVNTIPEIGSLRSARIVATELAAGTNSIFIHYGRNARVPEVIDQYGISHIDGNDCSAGSNNVRTAADGYLNLPSGLFFWRDSVWLSQRALEHTAVSDGIHILEGIEHFGIQREGFTPLLFRFAVESEDIANGDPCDAINVYFSPTNDDALFEYDEETGLYYKSQYGSPQIDLNIRESNANMSSQPSETDEEIILPSEQICFENVVVLYTHTVSHGDTTIDVHFEFRGTGWYVSEGRIIPISFIKDNTTDQITLYTVDGEELQVNRGRSYICIIDNDYINDSTYRATADDSMVPLEPVLNVTFPEVTAVHEPLDFN